MIPWFKPTFWGNEKKYVLDALESTWISDGQYIKNFESNFAQANEFSSCISVSNGTTALYLALLANNIGVGDEVIIPGYTFAAPANMVIAAGAKPVFVDVCSKTWLLNPKLIENAITNKTKAILPVHIYGNVCEMNEILSIARKHNLIVIEDVAEAAFSRQNNKFAGTIGDAGCFSFQATKTLTMGEGGAVFFADPNIEKKARAIRNHGMTPERPYWHFEVGHNFRLTNMQAALGCAQLEELETIIKHKKRVYERYRLHMEKIPGITMQQIYNHTDPVIWAVVATIGEEQFFCSRDQLRDLLKNLGIETRAGFFSFNQMPLYNASQNTPVADYLSKHVISFPSYPSLSNHEIDFICEQLINHKVVNYV